MNKSFDKLSVKEQIEFINTELSKDKKISVTKLCKKFGFNRSTVISRFIKEGYKYNPNIRKYVKNDNIDIELLQEKNNINNITPKDIQINSYIDNEDIKELIKYKDDILNILKEYKNNERTEKEMIIDTSIIQEKVQNHNFKVYKSVINEIQELQKQYQHFRLVDLVSSALHEYYQKYKK